LTEALGSTDPELRLDAAVALASLGENGKDVLPVLLEVIQTKNHLSRIRALEALAGLGAPSEATLTALLRALWDEGSARVKAAEVLGRLGPKAKVAVPALKELLKTSDPDSRLQAATALWKIEHRADESALALSGVLKNSATSAQRNTLVLPGRFGMSSGVAPPPCQQAAEALGQMGSAARPAVPALTEAMKAPDLASFRPYYALALLKIDRQNAGVAVPALIDLLDGKGQGTDQAASDLRKQAVLALGDIGAAAREAVPSLQKAADSDPDESVRTEASTALKKIGA
jgi:HEAT repeat protein